MNNIDGIDTSILDSNKREDLENFIDNLNVNINLILKGLTEADLLQLLSIEKEEINSLKDQFKEYMVYKGFYIEDLFFTDEGLVIVEKTIKDEEEFYKYIEELAGQDQVLDLASLEEEAMEILASMEIYRTVLYEDLRPKILETIMEREAIKLSRIFDLFEKMSLVEGYIPLDISITKKGIIIYQRPIRDEEEYLEEKLKIDNIGIELREHYYKARH